MPLASFDSQRLQLEPQRLSDCPLSFVLICTLVRHYSCMATVARYIYSHYDPPRKPLLEHHSPDDEDRTGETHNEEFDPWLTESAFGAQQRVARAPQFVPAIVSYDEVNDMIGSPTEAQQLRAMRRGEDVEKEDVAGWYRSLARSNTASGKNTPPIGASLISSSETLASPSPTTSIAVDANAKQVKPMKNDWFIRRALCDEHQRSSAPSTPPSTLADILSRDPPAQSKENALRPPVFLTLGPSNRGFGMLERKGWREGEALGPYVARKEPATVVEGGGKEKGKGKERAVDGEGLAVTEERREVAYGSDGEVSEVRTVEVVDLTLSDSEVSATGDDESIDTENQHTPSASLAQTLPLLSPSGKALFTPLPTVLKSDRLGIGLKAKTEGPYKQSKKRVTHSQAAMVAHIRAAEEMKKMKKVMGRGSRAFARIAKKEEEKRKRLLASLNEP